MDIIAHRGASGYRPENTLPSIQEAISLGADIIEIDVFVIKTGEVVVFHDDTVDRTTDGTGKITDFTLEELRKLDAGGGDRIPLLGEVLDLINQRIPINIEMKGSGIAAPVAKVIDTYITQHGWDEADFLVSSYNFAELLAFTRIRPAIRIGILFRGAPPPHHQIIGKNGNAYSANLAANLATPETIQQAHRHGLKVFVYTVNDEAEALRLKALKVDGVFTDFPDKILAAVEPET